MNLIQNTCVPSIQLQIILSTISILSSSLDQEPNLQFYDILFKQLWAIFVDSDEENVKEKDNQVMIT